MKQYTEKWKCYYTKENLDTYEYNKNCGLFKTFSTIYIDIRRDIKINFQWDVTRSFCSFEKLYISITKNLTWSIDQQSVAKGLRELLILKTLGTHSTRGVFK